MTSNVEQLEALGRMWRQEDYRSGGGSCRADILRYLKSGPELLRRRATEPVRTALLVALADLHSLAGWTCFDTGLLDMAHRHFRTALELASEAGHDALAANIHYRIGRVHLHHGTFSQALEEFRLGEHAARKSGSLHAVSLMNVNQAWAFAEMARAQDAMTLLDKGRREFTRSDRANLPPWSVFFDETDLRAMIGTVHTVLATIVDVGHARSAIPLLSAALAAYPDGMARSRTFSLISLATCHLLAGDADQADTVLTSALDISATLRSTRPRDRMRSLTVAAQRRSDNPSARRMVERITAFRR
jgi:tetratricopeptide (TPR) repeat protein